MKPKRKERLEKLLHEIEELIQHVLEWEEEYFEKIKQVHPKYSKSATNLVHYWALKSKKLNSLQRRLGNFGLSKLSESEPHIMASLQTTRAILFNMLGENCEFSKHKLSFKNSRKLRRNNAKSLLGYRSKGRRTRIMVTLPTSASEDYKLVYNLIKNGMNCARINCAHDTAEEWQKMVDHVRNASERLRKKCKISMDLGGPKIRTGAIAKDAKIIKLERSKDTLGNVNKPINLFFGESQSDELDIPHIPLKNFKQNAVNEGDFLFFEDSHFKKRKIEVKKISKFGFIGEIRKTTLFETGLPIKIDENNFFIIGELDEKKKPIYLRENDTLIIKKKQIEGKRAKISPETGEIITPAFISCTAPEIFSMVKIEDPILFDDGEIEGIIKNIDSNEMKILITKVSDKIGKLKSDKGINFPKSDIHLPSLSEKDKRDLKFVLKNSNVIDMSFVNRPQDVSELLKILDDANLDRKMGLILKIETQTGVDNIVDIILEAMKIYPVGVMIARGDLAVETGWDKIGRIQEELLSICKASHLTSIWATQVLENLAKKGIPARAEISDTVIASSADCIMLNKGPYIIRAINLLTTILKNLKKHSMALKPSQD